MTGASKTRAPAAFRLDKTGGIEFSEEHDAPVPILAPVPHQRRRWPWGRVFVSALGTLLSFGLALWAYDAVVALFARQGWLGWTALGLSGLAGLGLLGWLGREVAGLLRLRRLGRVRDLAAHADTGQTAALRLADELTRLYSRRPDLAGAIAELTRHRAEIIDAADRVALTERLLMAPLDAQARALVANAAKRVSVVTAISPAAVIDLGFVAYSHMGLIRRLAELYGGRPGLLASMRLMRLVITHLAVTGGIALGDGLLQQILGHGLAARLSARLGEGVLNGILATRVGLAAIEVCRPMPFAAVARPTMSELAASLATGGGKT
ncbi:GTP-binding protein [hydrothermal vent metagenome]|uniref:GTP-binding protein n=1 Tax=hydrothermal vent metagenome TaxID=652676 RepID=A0A3B0SYF3_9ZZZZ